jgi:hypothetical protein
VGRPEELRDRLRRLPFPPLVLLDSLDAHHEIRHPELVMVGERSLTIGIPSPTHPAIYTHTICISLEQVVRWEDLPATPSCPAATARRRPRSPKGRLEPGGRQPVWEMFPFDRIGWTGGWRSA